MMMRLINLPAGKVGPGYWFAPKRYGFGAVPANRAGWLFTIGFVAALAAVGAWLPGDEAKLAAAIALVAIFVTVVWLKTDGGWRWRWGGNDE